MRRGLRGWYLEGSTEISPGKTLRKEMLFVKKHIDALGYVRIRQDCIIEKEKAKNEKIFLVCSSDTIAFQCC